ncbi:hypothetical protein TVAG_387860 [Trichomonas vaginalis G3]|uniref:Rab-GAP TBC domain-containing protein n=1 Tax=Trichomonas vaginalis (strain ATCC PRA-98 / G3) TaxID=412133 RepID=A2E113_TRIV3|nr:Rab-GTPase-TBC domain family [Trichomonas vaginalis G3]EAY13645.1 hypothetical protein TVAG_387860 [Trichomonas vaginalis G3]KAI5529919.1 Rab-GTPase-TBC domain family [Trichomonas vaginalis G3]|eukprot:XP_001325868.1 hypothetical protein [Trichomonas vaginalis G3]
MQVLRSKLDDQRLNEAVYGANNSIKSRLDAEKFLLQDDTFWKFTDRFISWMVCLNILPSDSFKWGNHLLQLISKYESYVNSELFENPDAPLLALPGKAEAQIHTDLTRTVKFFSDLANSSQLPSDKQNYTLFRASRILTIMTLTEPSFQYIQGCERYVYICYLISLLFTTQNQLPDIFAEATAYYLAVKMIEMSGIAKLLSSSKFLEEHFKLLDAKFAQINSELMEHLTFANQSSINFALRWQILFFAEEHDYSGIVSIWDRIISHRQSVNQYIEALCLAHFNQLPDLQLKQVQHYRNWNVKQILEDAEKFINPEVNYGWGTAFMVCLTVGVLSLMRIMNH